MKKTLYIHIGRPKVGSTAIQRFLKSNRNVLLEEGVLYPVAGELQNASHRLAAVLLSSSNRGVDASAVTLYDELASEIEKSSASKCIVSSENFYFVRPKLVAEMLAGRFDVKIVCYIRRQDEVLVSSFMQELRDDSLAAYERENLDLYLSSTVRLRLLDYKMILDRWAEVFGDESIVARVYEGGQLKGDLYNDILDVVGLSLNDAYSVPDQRINPTPSSDVLELINIVNGYSASPILRKQLKARLIEISEKIGSNPVYDAKRIFSIAQRKQAMAHFEKSNAATARKYLNRDDGRLFYHDVADNDAEVANVENIQGKFDLTRMVEIWAGIVVYQQQEIIKLAMQLEKLQNTEAD